MVIDRRKILLAMLSSLSLGGSARAGRLQQRLFISCRLDGQNNASVSCFDAEGGEIFATSLPARGHDITRRPGHDEIIVFARRPGNWFAAVSSRDGGLVAALHAPEGRHLYGHGVFSPDGRLLYVTENNMTSGDGLVGIYDATNHYRRIGEFSSGGIGPHDIALLPGGHTLVIANGGLRTHPATGRETLNSGDMKPNLVFADLNHGNVLGRHELARDLRQLSIRHLAVRSDGLVAFGCQYEGSPEDAPPLLGLIESGHAPRMLEVDDETLFRMKNYIGSVAFGDDGRYLMATSPRGGTALLLDVESRAVRKTVSLPDVCGVAALGADRFLMSSGNAGIAAIGLSAGTPVVHASHWVWDNHMETLIPS